MVSRYVLINNACMCLLCAIIVTPTIVLGDDHVLRRLSIATFVWCVSSAVYLWSARSVHSIALSIIPCVYLCMYMSLRGFASRMITKDDTPITTICSTLLQFSLFGCAYGGSYRGISIWTKLVSLIPGIISFHIIAKEAIYTVWQYDVLVMVTLVKSVAMSSFNMQACVKGINHNQSRWEAVRQTLTRRTPEDAICNLCNSVALTQFTKVGVSFVYAVLCSVLEWESKQWAFIQLGVFTILSFVIFVYFHAIDSPKRSVHSNIFAFVNIFAQVILFLVQNRYNYRIDQYIFAMSQMHGSLYDIWSYSITGLSVRATVMLYISCGTVLHVPTVLFINRMNHDIQASCIFTISKFVRYQFGSFVSNITFLILSDFA